MKKLVLAYSGGLDTSYCAHYLSQVEGYEVNAVTINTGGFEAAELKSIRERAVELGALAISTRFRNNRVGVYTVAAFMRKMRQEGFHKFISLSNNPRLRDLYLKINFIPLSPPVPKASSL